MTKLSNNQKAKTFAAGALGTLFSGMPPYLKMFFTSSAVNVGVGIVSNLFNIISSSIFATKIPSNSNNYKNYMQQSKPVASNPDFKKPTLNLC